MKSRFSYLCCQRPVFTITNVSSGKAVFGVEYQDGIRVQQSVVAGSLRMADRRPSVLKPGIVNCRSLDSTQAAAAGGGAAPKAQSDRGGSHPESARAFLFE